MKVTLLDAMLRRYIKRCLAKRQYAIYKKNELTRLADFYGSDKGTFLSAHSYTRIYEKFFRGLRCRPICLVEIGLCRPDADARRVAVAGKSIISGFRTPSLDMWRAYFPKATLFGFDIDDFSYVKIEGCTIMRGDAASRDCLDELIRAIRRPIDILIDDASHLSHHQQLCLGMLFPKMASGGMYIIEDMHWQDSRFEKIDALKTRQLLRKFQVQGIFESSYLSVDENEYIKRNTESVWLFDSLTSEVDDASDALGIVVKR